MLPSTLGARASFLAASLLAALSAGCGSAPAAEAFQGAPPSRITAQRLPDGSLDDRSRCEWRNREDRESVETAGPGAIVPNVRRVYAIMGQGPDRGRVLVCREIDSNLDGVKDVVRKYNEKGESLFEEADVNHDGKIDTWNTFSKGRLAETKLDADFDGNPDEWKFYNEGKLVRARRDTNRDGKADHWELYGSDGKLERMGVDVDGDERVDRWDYDTDIRRAREEKERRDEEEAARKVEEARKAGEYKEAEEAPADDDKKDRKPAAKRAQEEAAKKPQ